MRYFNIVTTQDYRPSMTIVFTAHGTSNLRIARSFAHKYGTRVWLTPQLINELMRGYKNWLADLYSEFPSMLEESLIEEMTTNTKTHNQTPVQAIYLALAQIKASIDLGVRFAFYYNETGDDEN